MDVLVPKDWGFSDLLFASIPEFYQRTDYQEAADGRIGPLKRFTSVLGYDLDYTQSLCDGLLHLYDFDKAPWRLLQHLGDNMGFPYEATLGANRTRSVLEQLADLNDLRGTRLGLQRLITAASDYECDVLEGYNDMLAVDDGDFAGGGGSGLVGNADPMLWGIGHWVPMTDTTLLDTIIDPTGTFDASPAAATPPIIAKNTTAGPANILSPPGGRGALVVNGPGPQTVISCGQIDSTGEPEHDQNSVILAGIPVRPGDLYEFSVETIRTAWGSAGEQPPQARVVLAIMWFDTDGAHLSTTNGPDVPDNYDEATWERSMVQEFAPDDSVYAVPAIWCDLGRSLDRPTDSANLRALHLDGAVRRCADRRGRRRCCANVAGHLPHAGRG
jgi:phage tail-like protein